MKRRARRSLIRLGIVCVVAIGFFFVSLLVGRGASLSRTDHQDTDDVITHTVHLPLVARTMAPSTHVTRTPGANWHLIASGRSLQDALDGSDVRVRRDDDWFEVINAGPEDLWMSDHRYYVKRDLISFDLSQVPRGTIVSATLELTSWTLEDSIKLKFHEGTWSAPPDAQAWDSYGELLGTYGTDHHDGEPHVFVSLPGLVGRRTPSSSDLLMTARGDEVTEMVSENKRVTLALRHWWEGYPVSHLHLEIREA